MRINKYLSECGICSRREADRLLAAGRVLVNGQPAEMGARVTDEDLVLVDGQPVRAEQTKVYLKLYKPRGIVCTADPREKQNLIDFLHYPRRITYAGRLDKDSEGLMILTDDGDLIDRMMRAREAHEKEYLVTVDREIGPAFAKRMAGGLFLPELQVRTRPCQVELLSPNHFRIVLTQGYNRQIRRMCEVCGCRVKRLKRTRIVNIQLGDLKPGEYKELTEEELSRLKEATGKDA